MPNNQDISFDPSPQTKEKETTSEDTFEIEFGNKNLANEYREKYSDSTTGKYDARYKSIEFVETLDEQSKEEIIAAAAGSRADKESVKSQSPLTDAETKRIKDKSTYTGDLISPRWVKGIAGHYGVQDWLSYYDPTLTVDEHIEVMENAKTDEIGANLDAEADGEGNINEQLATGHAKAQKANCSSAEDACVDNDDNAACRHLVNNCGWSDEEIKEVAAISDPIEPHAPDPSPEAELYNKDSDLPDTIGDWHRAAGLTWVHESGNYAASLATIVGAETKSALEANLANGDVVINILRPSIDRAAVRRDFKDYLEELTAEDAQNLLNEIDAEPQTKYASSRIPDADETPDPSEGADTPDTKITADTPVTALTGIGDVTSQTLVKDYNIDTVADLRDNPDALETVAEPYLDNIKAEANIDWTPTEENDHEPGTTMETPDIEPLDPIEGVSEEDQIKAAKRMSQRNGKAVEMDMGKQAEEVVYDYDDWEGRENQVDLKGVDTVPMPETAEGRAAKALSEAWNGYKKFRGDASNADTADEYNEARDEMRHFSAVINGVRNAMGQAPIEFDPLETVPDDATPFDGGALLPSDVASVENFDPEMYADADLDDPLSLDPSPKAKKQETRADGGAVKEPEDKDSIINQVSQLLGF